MKRNLQMMKWYLKGIKNGEIVSRQYPLSTSHFQMSIEKLMYRETRTQVTQAKLGWDHLLYQQAAKQTNNKRLSWIQHQVLIGWYNCNNPLADELLNLTNTNLRILTSVILKYCRFSSQREFGWLQLVQYVPRLSHWSCKKPGSLGPIQ